MVGAFSEPMEKKKASEFLLSQLINNWIREVFFPTKEFSIDQAICVLCLKDFWLVVIRDFIGPPQWLVSLTFRHPFLIWIFYLRNF